MASGADMHFVDALNNGAKLLKGTGEEYLRNQVKKLMNKYLPSAERSKFATECLVGQKLRERKSAVEARESVVGDTFWSYRDASSTCLTHSVESKFEPGGVSRAIAVCPAGTTMMSGGLTLAGSQPKGRVVDAPYSKRANAWECSVSDGNIGVVDDSDNNQDLARPLCLPVP